MRVRRGLLVDYLQHRGHLAHEEVAPVRGHVPLRVCTSDVRRYHDGKTKVGRSCQLSILTLAPQHEVIDIVRVMQAYTENESDPNWPAEYYAQLKSSMSVFKTVIYTVVTIISDAFIVSFLLL